MSNSVLRNAVVATFCVSFVISHTVQAAVIDYDFNAVLTQLAPHGSAVRIEKTTDQYQTHLIGTMLFNTVSGAGTAVIAPFFFGGTLEPAVITDYTMQTIGDGAGGSGTLMLANFLLSYQIASDIPVSVVLDAAGFFNGELTVGGSNGAIPASDGTFVGDVSGTVVGPGGNPGYLGLGPVPIATTAWNTTNTTGCTLGDCLGVAVSGTLPLIFDAETNTNDYTTNSGGAIGGSPIQDDRNQFHNINLDFTSMTVVPIPASVWLFGSGLIGFIGLARRQA